MACDNITVVRNIRGKGFGSYGHVIQEIKARGDSFTSVEFVYEGRMSNGDAHRLARGSLRQLVDMFGLLVRRKACVLLILGLVNKV